MPDEEVETRDETKVEETADTKTTTKTHDEAGKAEVHEKETKVEEK